jgi:hypothetical protein
MCLNTMAQQYWTRTDIPANVPHPAELVRIRPVNSDDSRALLIIKVFLPESVLQCKKAVQMSIFNPDSKT